MENSTFPAKNALAYIRVSTTDQAGEDRFGLQAQRTAIMDYANKEGFVITDWLEDDGISGATMDRPGLTALLDTAKNPPTTAVIVAKMDRIARDLMAQLWIEKELLKTNVELISAAEPFRGQDPSSVLFRQIIGSFAQFEKARIAERMSGGRKAKAKTGGYAGGGAPMGYSAKRGSKELTVDPAEAATVNAVFAMRTAHPDHSLRLLAEAMNEAGYTTREGKKWQAMQVQRILKRQAFYEGEYCYSGITAQGQQEAILE